MGFVSSLLGLLGGQLSGSGRFLQERVEAGISEEQERLDATAFLETTPPGFDLKDLGHLMLIYFEDPLDQIMTVRSCVRGKGKNWRGVVRPNAPIFAYLEIEHPIDISRFCDYVHNFKYVLWDTRDGRHWHISEEEADKIIYQLDAEAPDMRLYAAAASR